MAQPQKSSELDSKEVQDGSVEPAKKYPLGVETQTRTIDGQEVEIRIIRPKCISAGTCVVYAPDTFDDEDIAIIKEGGWDRLEKIMAGAESCPVYAIEVIIDGVKKYPKG